MTRQRWVLASSCVALLSWMPGCYEGVPDIEGEPWQGQGESGGGTDGGYAPIDGETEDGGGTDGGTTDPTGDPTASDPTDGGTSDPTADPTDDPSGDPTGDSDGGSTGEPVDDPPPSDEVPDNAYCQGVADWNPSYTALENQILEIVNQRRAEGANCGSAGSFGPAGPLSMNPALRCAARVHSKDMVDRNFFDHTNPSGESPFVRMGHAGYSYSTAGENIAAGNSTAAATMQQWMNSDGHCGNIMNPAFTEIGVGYYPGGQYGHVWTQTFGAP